MSHDASHRCYARGCRLPECVEAHRIYMRDYRQNRSATRSPARATANTSRARDRGREAARRRAATRLTRLYPGVFSRLLTDELGESA